VPGEEAWPTQPAGVSLGRETLTAADAWGLDDEERRWCAEKIAASRVEGIFTPPSLKGTVVFPGNVGGVNWGSAALEPSRNLLVMNLNHLATWVKLIPRADLAEVYRTREQNRMSGEFARQTGAPFGMYRETLLSPRHRLPCNPPPWGTVVAVDLASGRKVWEVPLGSMLPDQSRDRGAMAQDEERRNSPRAFRMPTGAVNLGGPIVTAGGIVFTAAAWDGYLRAFDVEDGTELWSYVLPAGGQATPMTYAVGGKQYLVIAAGGHAKMGTKLGDHVLAFALP
jgi:quinoprotein glucose dehydrogenase